MGRVWFVTGSSRGLGREFTAAALARGDRVAAAARHVAALDDLVAAYGDAILPLALDVTDQAAVVKSVQQTHDCFGRLDIVVNNAGHIVHGAVEELDEQELRNQLETNLFGPLWVARAALPLLRKQGSGHIVQISSLAGIAAYPTLGACHASKWALEGLSEALAGEVGQFGIKVTIVEPGSFRTSFGAGAVRPAAGVRPPERSAAVGSPGPGAGRSRCRRAGPTKDRRREGTAAPGHLRSAAVPRRPPDLRGAARNLGCVGRAVRAGPGKHNRRRVS